MLCGEMFLDEAENHHIYQVRKRMSTDGMFCVVRCDLDLCNLVHPSILLLRIYMDLIRLV